MSALRVGVDGSSWASGRGLARYLQGLFGAMGALPDAPSLVFFCPPGCRPEVGVPIERVEVAPGFLPRSWTDGLLPRAVRRAGIDLMHFPANSFWSRPRRPTVVTIHDLALLDFPMRFFSSRWAAARYRARFARLPRIAAGVIAVSAHTAQRMGMRGRGAHAVTVVPNGVDARFHGVAARRAPEPGLVLYVGALDFRKNLLHLLAAFERARREHPTARLVLAGHRGSDPRVYPPLEAEAAAHGLAGALEIVADPDDAAILDLYGRASVFVFPSTYEGFGLPVLEAMAAGCPVACSRAGPLPEVAGEAALLFDPASVPQMADAIGRLLSEPDLAARLADAGRERAAGYTWEKAARATLQVYRESLVRRR